MPEAKHVGETVEQILDSYPHVTPQGIRAALAYGADAVHREWLSRAK